MMHREGIRTMTTSLMKPQQQQQRVWSESIGLASTNTGRGGDGYRYRLSSTVSCVEHGRPHIRHREGVCLGVSLTPTAFAESVLCYIGVDAPGQCAVYARLIVIIKLVVRASCY